MITHLQEAWKIQNKVTYSSTLSKERKWSRSVMSDFATPWTIAYQAPPPMGFSRQEYWSGLPFPSPGDLPNPGIEPTSPALQVDSLPLSHRGCALVIAKSKLYFWVIYLEERNVIWDVSNLWDITTDTENKVSQTLHQISKSSSHTWVPKDKKSGSTILLTKERKVKLLSHVRLFVTQWTVAHQAPLSMGFSRQEYWSGLPFPSTGDLPNPGIEPRSPVLQVDILSSEPPGKPY